MMGFKLRFAMDATVNSTQEVTEADEYHRTETKTNNTLKTELTAMEDMRERSHSQDRLK